MDWHVLFGICAGIFGIVSVIPYVKDILHGTTRPNIVSQTIWLIIAATALGTQFAAGAAWPLAVSAATTCNCILIVGLALAGYGYRAYEKLDLVCFLLAFIAIGVWLGMNDPILALILVIFVEIVATVPTIYKLFRAPDSEDTLAWSLLAVAAVFGLASTRELNLANLLYPFATLLQSGTIAILAFVGRRRLKRANELG